ncbi:MAG: hypothetical protein IJV64_12255 [Oscillospiraceae bacterium]|nr:hypothetical protein [Oscillospiraceae bacterium]
MGGWHGDFVQRQKIVEKSVDKSLRGVYSSHCSAVEPLETKRSESDEKQPAERVPCKLNNEEMTKAPESDVRDHIGRLEVTGLSQLPVAEGKRNEAMTNSSIKD